MTKHLDLGPQSVPGEVAYPATATINESMIPAPISAGARHLPDPLFPDRERRIPGATPELIPDDTKIHLGAGRHDNLDVGSLPYTVVRATPTILDCQVPSRAPSDDVSESSLWREWAMEGDTPAETNGPPVDQELHVQASFGTRLSSLDPFTEAARSTQPPGSARPAAVGVIEMRDSNAYDPVITANITPAVYGPGAQFVDSATKAPRTPSTSVPPKSYERETRGGVASSALDRAKLWAIMHKSDRSDWSTIGAITGQPGDPRDGGKRKHMGFDWAPRVPDQVQVIARDSVFVRSYPHPGGYGYVDLITWDETSSDAILMAHGTPKFGDDPGGRWVDAGQPVHTIGSSGTATGRHVHAESVSFGATTGRATRPYWTKRIAVGADPTIWGWATLNLFPKENVK